MHQKKLETQIRFITYGAICKYRRTCLVGEPIPATGSSLSANE